MPEGSLVAALALPWLAMVALPRRAGEAGETSFGASPRGRAALAVALAAPLLALGASLEGQAGAGWGPISFEVAAVLVLIGLLALAADRAADRTADRAGGRLPVVGIGLLLLIALPLFTAVVGWNDAPGGAPEWLEAASGASPLTWAFRRAEGGAGPSPLDLLAPLVTVSVLAGWPRGGGA